MARYRMRQLVFDTSRLDRLVEFWTEALGYELDHRTGEYAVLRDPDGTEPKLSLQQLPEPKQGKNRAHVDLEVADEQAVVARLVELGATVLWRNAEDTWT